MSPPRHSRSQRQSVGGPLSSFDRGALFLWPIAILTILYQARDTLGPGTASDFIPVWQAARAFVDGAQPYQVMGFVYWPYYAIYLLPTFMAAISPGHAAANWRYLLFGVAGYLIASQDYLATFRGVRVTMGYVMLLTALSPPRRTPSIRTRSSSG